MWYCTLSLLQVAGDVQPCKES